MCSRKSGRSAIERTEDILSAATRLRAFMEKFQRNTFLADSDAVDSAVFKLFTIGEAAKHLAPGVEDRHPQIPWRQVRGMRDIIAHVYFGLDNVTVWDTATQSLDALIDAMQTELTYLQSLTPSP